MSSGETNGGYEADSELPLASLSVADLVRQLRAIPRDDASGRDRASPYCEEIIRRFEPVLRRYWREVSFRGEYQDFVQDVFVRLFGALRHLEDPQAFPGYFRALTRSVAFDWLRRQRTSPDGVPLDPERVVSRLDQAIDVAVCVHSYLEQLPPRERMVLSLEFVHGLGPEQIIQLTKLTRGGVSAAKTRGIKRLREILLREAEALEKAIATKKSGASVRPREVKEE